MKHSHIIIICIGLFCISSYLLYVSEGGLSFERPGSFVGFSDSLIHDNTTEKIPKKFIAVQYCAKNPKIRFFMYHYIRNDDPLDTIGTHNLSIPPSIFDGQMNMIEKLSQSGSITLMKGEDFLSSLKSSCYPSENIWIFTDDDGWSDSHSDLMPIAANHSIPFFFGIIGNRIDKHGFVTSGEVRSLASNPLFTISSHSLTHADESKMSIENEQKEMCESKKYSKISRENQLTRISIRVDEWTPVGVHRISKLVDIRLHGRQVSAGISIWEIRISLRSIAYASGEMMGKHSSRNISIYTNPEARYRLTRAR